MIGTAEGVETQIGECAIREEFAFFGRVAWNGDGIHCCSLQALVTEGCNLLDLYLASPEEAREMTAKYYRLDLDLKAPGPLFKEASPHIHAFPDGAPRFPFACSDEYIPISFFEFIYLNHFHDEWLAWARSVALNHDAEFPFDAIAEGFDSGGIVARIAEFRDYLSRLKRLLSNAKRGRVPDAPQPNACVLDLTYAPWSIGKEA